jgi:Tol biopolymer transport system component
MVRRPSRCVGVAAVVAVCAVGACAPPPQPPAPFAGRTVRVSVSADGEQANGGSGSSSTSLSADGRYVAFFSAASNLIQGDTNSTGDLFVADRGTGEVERVSVTSNGDEVQGIPAFGSGSVGGAAMGMMGISDDGQVVAFASSSNGLVPDDTNFIYLFGLPWFPMADVFVHDRSTGITERVSVSSGGIQGNGMSGERGGVVLSRDGRFVAFQSDASTLVPGDTNGSSDVFVRDRQTNETTRISVSGTGGQAAGGAVGVAMSADGRFVAFVSSAPNLVPLDTNESFDVFVHDRLTGATTRVSEGSDGTPFEFSGWYGLTVSGDGCRVAFSSSGPEDQGEPGIYLHDCATGETERVLTDQTVSLAFSRDGRNLAYNRLIAIPNDSGGWDHAYDVRLLEVATGRVKAVDAGPGGSAPDGNSFIPSVSADGSVVAFTSDATNLVSGDTNDASDVFVFDSVRR